MEMKIKTLMLMLLILFAFCIIPASADTFNKTYSEFKYQTSTLKGPTSGAVAGGTDMYIIFDTTKTWSDYDGLYYIGYSVGNLYSTSWAEGIDHTFEMLDAVGGNIYATGTIQKKIKYTALGAYDGYDAWILIDDFKTEDLIADSEPLNTNFVIRVNGAYSTVTGVNWKQTITPEIDSGCCKVYLGANTKYYPDGNPAFYSSTYSSWSTELGANYNYGEINRLDINTNVYANVSITDLDKNVLYESYDIGVRYLLFTQLPVYFKTVSPYGNVYYDYISVGAGTFDLSVSKSPAGLQENYTIYLSGLADLTTVNKVYWSSRPVDDYGNIITGTLEDRLDYYTRINDTHWQRFIVDNGELFADIIPETSSVFFSQTVNFDTSGTYQTRCTIFDVTNSKIGEPYIDNIVGSGITDLNTLTVRILDGSTGNGLSLAHLLFYKYNQTTLLEEYLFDSDMPGSTQNYNLASGYFYKLYVNRTGYSATQTTFSMDEDKTLTFTLIPESLSGNSTLSFKVRDTANNYLKNAVVVCNGLTQLTKINGQASFTDLPINNTYDYSVSLSGYITETGSIYADNGTELINVILYTEEQAFPTTSPTEITPAQLSNMTILDQYLYYFSELGFTEEQTKTIIGYIIILICYTYAAKLAGTYAGILGASIGLLVSVGLTFVPLWHVYVFVLISSAIIAIRLRL